MLNKKAIGNAVFVIILVVALIGVGLTLWSLQMPVSSPTAYVVEPIFQEQGIQPQVIPCDADCDDTTGAISPGVPEVCGNLIDDNCNGEIDEDCCGNGVQESGEQCDPPGSSCFLGGNEGICTDATVVNAGGPCSCNTALCQFCGDGTCQFDENAQSCQQDCIPFCGNLACEANEGNSCPEDCQAVCGNGACEGGQHICQDGDCDCPGTNPCPETSNTCQADCGSGSVCAGNALCQFSRFVFDPGDEGAFINCNVDCCTAACETNDDCTPNDNYPCISGTCSLPEGFCDFDEIEGCCDSDDDCNDELFCTGEETCDEQTNTCQEGTAVVCDDQIDCTDDACDEGENACAFTPDNDFCDDQTCCTQDTCDPQTGCANDLIDVDQDGVGVECTEPVWFENNAQRPLQIYCNDCDDGDPFNFPGNPEDCTDGQDNDCDGDVDCDDSDCENEQVCQCFGPADCPVPDNPCLDPDCQSGTCTSIPDDNNQCTDGDPCTNDACSQGTCVSTPQVCNDEKICTTDSCVSGNCIFNPINCNDQDPCTEDTCNEQQIDSIIPQQTPCVHTPIIPCNPPGGGGGGQQFAECVDLPEGFVPTGKPCSACLPTEVCARASTKSGSGATLTQCRCARRGESVPPAAPPVQTPQGNTGQTENNFQPPQELPTRAESGNQESFIDQEPTSEQLNQRRQRTPIEGAISQPYEKSIAPAAWTVLLLIALFLGIYAYFNREQLASFFKKEEKKAEPAVKELQKEWKLITHPKKNSPHKARRRK